jgi:hypothetical protein
MIKRNHTEKWKKERMGWCCIVVGAMVDFSEKGLKENDGVIVVAT